jgi:Zn-dependent peptidase ImmA (M78 family)
MNDIERFAAKVQNTIWNYKHILWQNEIAEDGYLDILDPKVILMKLGYQYQETLSLGAHETDDDTFEVAGIIDSTKKYVAISENFTDETMAFTVAHELGHALLHPNSVLHRDRPMDGSHANIPKDFRERQADRFAACFLMPKKLVVSQLEARFGTKKIFLDNKTANDLGAKLSDLKDHCKTTRDFARVIAEVNQVTFNTFDSMAEQFRVSTGAMAIRLEELGLVAI